MRDNEYVRDHLKEGLPPREHNAEVPAHTNGSTIWLSGIIAACAIVALLMFGNSGRYSSVSNSPNTEPGVTTGAAPAPSQTGTR
jgi:hypothetical protein